MHFPLVATAFSSPCLRNDIAEGAAVENVSPCEMLLARCEMPSRSRKCCELRAIWHSARPRPNAQVCATAASFGRLLAESEKKRRLCIKKNAPAPFVPFLARPLFFCFCFSFLLCFFLRFVFACNIWHWKAEGRRCAHL